MDHRRGCCCCTLHRPCAYTHPRSSHPPAAPENLLCCLRFIINPSFCPSLSSACSLATSTNPSTRAVYLGARARETGAGILNSKYLSRRRGTGRRPDKQVERVQACMERLGWEIAKKANVRDISLNASNFYSRKNSICKNFPIYRLFICGVN